jgi:hypothetical protein
MASSSNLSYLVDNFDGHGDQSENDSGTECIPYSSVPDHEGASVEARSSSNSSGCSSTTTMIRRRPCRSSSASDWQSEIQDSANEGLSTSGSNCESSKEEDDLVHPSSILRQVSLFTPVERPYACVP